MSKPLPITTAIVDKAAMALRRSLIDEGFFTSTKSWGELREWEKDPYRRQAYAAIEEADKQRKRDRKAHSCPWCDMHTRRLWLIADRYLNERAGENEAWALQGLLDAVEQYRPELEEHNKATQEEDDKRNGND